MDCQDCKNFQPRQDRVKDLNEWLHTFGGFGKVSYLWLELEGKMALIVELGQSTFRFYLEKYQLPK